MPALPRTTLDIYYLRMNAGMGVCGPRLPDDQVDLVVEVFRMLADAHPGSSVVGVGEGRDVGQRLGQHVGKPTPSVSQHLAKLRMARLVRTRREGTTIFYSLDNDHIGNWSPTQCSTPNTPARVCPGITATPPSWPPCTPTPH